LIQEKDERGSVTEYKYDLDLLPGNPTNSGRLLQVLHPVATLPDGTKQTALSAYEWNTKGQLTAHISPNGTRTELEYGSAGFAKSRIVKITGDAGGINVERVLTYDSFGFERELTDGNGNSTEYVVNALGLVEKTLLPTVNGSRSELRLRYNVDQRIEVIERPKGTFSDPALIDDHIVDIFERDVLGYRIGFLLSSNTQEARRIRFCCDFRVCRTASPIQTEPASTALTTSAVFRFATRSLETMASRLGRKLPSTASEMSVELSRRSAKLQNLNTTFLKTD
jgi:YD repeat-containing protein